jgi:hypothetical protein
VSHWRNTGADPGFQVRGAHLIKLHPAEGGAKYLGYFVWKIAKNHIFSNFRGEARARCAPWIRPWNKYKFEVRPLVDMVSFLRLWLINGLVTKLTRRVSLLEQEQPTLPEHLSSPPGFSGVRITRSLVLCVCFVDRCLSFCTFFGHYVFCSFSIYGFWLPLWYLETLLR